MKLTIFMLWGIPVSLKHLIHLNWVIAADVRPSSGKMNDRHSEHVDIMFPLYNEDDINKHC